MPFEPGREKTGGRQVGTPNRATAEFKEFWQEFFESEEYRDSLKTRVLAGKADHMERYAAELLYGRPAQELRVRDDTVTVIIEKPPPFDGPQNPSMRLEDKPALKIEHLHR